VRGAPPAARGRTVPQARDPQCQRGPGPGAVTVGGRGAGTMQALRRLVASVVDVRRRLLTAARRGVKCPQLRGTAPPGGGAAPHGWVAVSGQKCVGPAVGCGADGRAVGMGVTGVSIGARKCPRATSTPSVLPVRSVKNPTRSPALLMPLRVVAPRPCGSLILRNPVRRDQVNPNDLALLPW